MAHFALPEDKNVHVLVYLIPDHIIKKKSGVPNE